MFISYYNFLKPLSTTTFARRLVHPLVCNSKSPETKKTFAKPDCKNAVIVGGTGAIGQATANQLFCAKVGKIALLDTDICKGEKAVSALNCTFGKNKAIFLKCNVTDKMDIHDSLLKAKSELKSVDIVINTFGIWDEKQWEYEVNLNLMGTLNVNQLAEDVITKPGMVLNVVGLSGTEPFSPSPVLAGSFHGVIGYTRSKGHEQNFMRTGIRVVALCSGITESPFTKDVIKKICCPHMSNDLKAYLDEACWQKPEAVAKAIVEVYKFGDSGSVWIVEGSRLFSLKLPDLKAHRVLENQFI